jgi:hypothetical protein
MYIVPFIKEAQEPVGPKISKYWLLLERNGTHLIEMEKGKEGQAAIEAAAEYMNINDVQLHGQPWISGPYVFVEVCAKDKELANFYSWKEVAPSSHPLKEVWRMFLFVCDKDGDYLGLNTLLGNIMIGESKSDTVLSVLTAAIQGPSSCTRRESP